ncbi:MAG: hypothetical protein KDA24_21610 [Deltaproteobacteria bacterium]|nr:hypothetical protein [Deltaproteobacteria bacterium]
MLVLLIRVVFFAAIVGAGVAFWRLIQPDKRLKIPSEWTKEAQGTPWLGEAIELRQKIAKRIIAGQAASGSDLLDDVDGVMRRLVEIADVEDHAEDLSADVGDRLNDSMAKLTAERQEALGWLTQAYAVLVESAASEFDSAVANLHTGLSAHKEELRHEVEARREINQALKQ